MKIKKFLYIVLASISLATVSNSISVQAEEVNTSIVEAATDLAKDNMGWDEVAVKNIKELYNFNNELIAYSVDLENKEDSSKGYEIINANNYNNVLEFSKEKCSMFSTISNNNKCVYTGFLNYYSKDINGEYFDLTNDKKLTNTDIDKLKNISRNINNLSNYVSENYASANYAIASANDTADSQTKEKIIADVPDERWYKGCTPTAVGMVLEYDFYDYVPEFRPLVRVLASNMGTDSDGNTYIDKEHYIDGIIKTMNGYGVDDISVVLDGKGRDQSTYEEFVNEIDNNYPLITNLYNSTMTTDAYPYGFGNHSLASVGYKYTEDQQFIIVHTSGIEGDVYCDFNSSLLGTHQWTYIH